MRSRVLPHVRELHAYVPGEQPKVPGLVKLNTNENPYPPSPRVLSTLRKSVGSKLRLYPDPTCETLRKAIAKRFRFHADQVFIGNGSDEILSLALRAFAAPGSVVAFPEPSYSLYPVLTRIQNAKPLAIPFDSKWRIDPALFPAVASVTFVANPNAPSGTLVARSALQALARKLSGVLVIDEAYVDFSSENAIDFAQRFENVLVTRSFSKSYGLAGMRIGFAAGNASLIEALLKVKDSYNVDRLAQVAALAAFQDTAYLRSTVDRVRKTRKKLTGGLRKLGWEVLDSEANFVFGKPPRPAGEVMAALRRAKILVRHFPGPRTGESLRISVGTDREIELLLRALGRTSGGTV